MCFKIGSTPWCVVKNILKYCNNSYPAPTYCTMDQSTIFYLFFWGGLCVSLFTYSIDMRLVAIRKDQSRHLIYSPCFFATLKCSSNSPRPEFLYIYCIHLFKELNRASKADLLNFTHFA